MQEQKYEELERRATEKELATAERQDLIRRLEAQSHVNSTIQEMLAEGKALTLSEEEERMLRSFRRFRCGCKPGAVFRWQTRPIEGVHIVTETGLIRDPQEVSE